MIGCNNVLDVCKCTCTYVYMCDCVYMYSMCVCVCVCMYTHLTIVLFTLTVWELSGPDQELSYISQLCKPYSTHKVCHTCSLISANHLTAFLTKHKVVHVGLPLEWQLSYIKPPITENKTIGL